MLAWPAGTAPCCSTAAGSTGPPWSVRVSLANLDTEDYLTIGHHLREIISEAVEAWKQARRAGNGHGNGNGSGNGGGQ